VSSECLFFFVYAIFASHNRNGIDGASGAITVAKD
jgi:hypothetical protein